MKTDNQEVSQTIKQQVYAAFWAREMGGCHVTLLRIELVWSLAPLTIQGANPYWSLLTVTTRLSHKQQENS
jgi:hypothetical protein